MKKLFLYLGLLLLSSEASAQYYDGYYSHYRRLSIDVQHTSFNDILNTPDNEELELEPVLNVNVNLRFYRTFSLILSHGTSKQMSYNGLGFRMDLPGVFFINGSPNDFVRKSKKRTWNTYLQVLKLMTSAEGNEEEFVCDKMGFGLDAFIAGGVYLNFEANLFSYQGNQFVAPTVGIGFEF